MGNQNGKINNNRIEEKMVVEAVLRTLTKVKGMDDVSDEVFNSLSAVERSMIGLAGMIYDTDITVINEDVKRSVFDYEMMEIDAEEFIADASKTTWTQFELDRLKELASLGVAWTDIASSLHRTVAACRSRHIQMQRAKKPKSVA